MQNLKPSFVFQLFQRSRFFNSFKSLGNKVHLITSEKLRDKPWPHDYIDETFTWKVRISIGI
jgi:hypothetical protein